MAPQVALGITSFSVNTTSNGAPPGCWLAVKSSQTGLQVQPSMAGLGWSIGKVSFIAAVSSELLLDLLSARTSPETLRILKFRSTAVPGRRAV